MKDIIEKIFEKREKGYYILLFLFLFVIVISQLFMRTGGMMGYFSAIETFEGDFITGDDMFNKSEITIEIKGELPEPLPEIYANGERVGFMDTKGKKLIIETNSVIEIFCEEEPSDMDVNVRWDDKKLTNYMNASCTNIKKGFNVVARLVFNE